MDIPRVTVLMSVYNGERFLGEAIESIINQSYGNFEFLIINDGSTDSTLNIIKSYSDSRIVLINNIVNLGLTKSLNKGLSFAKGEFIARMDADDISHKSRFEKQVKYLDMHPEVVLLGSQARIINKEGIVLKSPKFRNRPTSAISIRFYCMFNNPFIHSSVIMRKNIIWNKYGGYSTSFSTSQDYYLWCRVLYEHDCRNLNEPLIDFRWHSKSISSNYSREDLNKISTAYRLAIIKGLGRTPNEKLINQWIMKINPCWYKKKFDIQYFIKHTDLMFKQFCSINDIAGEKEVLLLFKNYILLEVAYSTSGTDKFYSLYLFIRVCKSGFKTCYSDAPRYLIKLIFGSSIINNHNLTRAKILFRDVFVQPSEKN